MPVGMTDDKAQPKKEMQSPLCLAIFTDTKVGL